LYLVLGLAITLRDITLREAATGDAAQTIGRAKAA
jgi:hypothetical protein